MRRFNIGDRVICINNDISGDTNQLKIGNVYTVINHYNSPTFRDSVILKETSGLAWFESRFEPAYIKEFKDKMDAIINDETQ